jgi:hypothetical protein
MPGSAAARGENGEPTSVQTFLLDRIGGDIAFSDRIVRSEEKGQALLSTEQYRVTRLK